MTSNSSLSSPKSEGKGPFRLPAKSRPSVLDWRGTWQGTKRNCSPAHREVLFFLYSLFFLLPGPPNKRPLRNHSFRTRQHCPWACTFLRFGWEKERWEDSPDHKGLERNWHLGKNNFPSSWPSWSLPTDVENFPAALRPLRAPSLEPLLHKTHFPCGSNPNLPSPL